MKCSECKYKKFEEYNGSPSRYYCIHQDAAENASANIICRCDRGSSELKIKTSPRWCPLKSV